MKKEYLPTILIMILLIGCLLYYYLFFYNKYDNNNESKEITIIPTLVSKLENNSIWCASFQIVWNDLKDEVIKHDIVLSEDENNQMVLDLNKETTTTNDISSKYYYKKHGYMTFDLKREIEDAIKNKFQEKSDILDKFQFQEESDDYLLYAMLFREFEFETPFDILNDNTFGIKDDSDSKLDNNVKVLYYNDYNDYAIKLITKDNDELILVKGKNNSNNFLEIFNELDINNESNFLKDDTVSISNFNFKLEGKFKELENKHIKNTNFKILKAIQTINFKLDNVGGKVKSEAAISMTKGVSSSGRHFSFTNDYILFIKEKSKNKPYFAMKIDNMEKFK